ncbi:golgin subfamily A member 2-like [Perognathus longimembris pacificus]|uniref:golgin subfamily A member 2-like n=1 Tax=Perognathus longimembris pacificus TaxID=214514 RepID=UPI00201858C9|nr:golgin subfamily A member 2-like [Perognathus longimembris pacificus]
MEVLNELYQEKDERIHQLCQEKREKKEEFQELLLLLAGKGLEYQDKLLADTETPAADVTSDLSGPTKIKFREEQKGFEEVQVKDNVEHVQVEAGVPCPLEDSPTEHVVVLMPDIQHDEEQKGSEEVQLKDNVGPAPREAGVPCPLEDTPTEHVVLLMPDIRPHQELLGLGSKGSIPFFYRVMQMMSLQ